MTKEVKIFDDLEGMSRYAAGKFVELQNRAIAARGRFAVALAGGNTPKRLYQLLTEDEFSKQIAWDKVHLFFGDERFVPTSDPDSGLYTVRELILGKSPLPPANVHAVTTEGISMEESAKRYSSEMETFFGNELPAFDLILLGVGEDGHTASLFPEDTVHTEPVTKSMAVVTNASKLPPNRLSLTPEAIDSSLDAIMLAAGKSKTDIIGAILENGGQQGIVPAGRVHPQEAITWILDKEAAAKLA